MSGLDVYRTITAFGWDVSWKSDKPVPDDAWPIDIINRAIAAAVLAERARCAKVARAYQPPYEPRTLDVSYAIERTAQRIAAAIEGGDDAG